MRLRAGTSGFSYKEWKGPFYPEKLPNKDMLGYYAELGARPLDVQPQRFVTDRQISLGYMHSGYPIMTHLDAAERFVDLERLSTKGDWGMFHEMGHNLNLSHGGNPAEAGIRNQNLLSGIQKRRFSPTTISCTPSVQPSITASSGRPIGSPRTTELSNILPSVVQPV